MTARLPATTPALMRTIEELNYRVTVGDVAARTGLKLGQTQQGLMLLAVETGGDLQVSGQGEIVYLFAQNFRDILRNKFLMMRVREVLQQIWRVVFYIIRISFGIILMGLIVAAIVAIIALAIAAQASRGNDSDSNWGDFGWNERGGGGWWHPNIFWLFDWNVDSGERWRRQRSQAETTKLSFLEAIFSFLFGDGDPNADLEERRWQSIGAIIRNSKGAIIAEQVTPFLDQTETLLEGEASILPVLLRFDGEPEVSPEGEIIYHFPQLQATTEAQRPSSVPSYLRERPWEFSQATTGQKTIAMILGVVLLILGIMLSGMLAAAGAVPFWIQLVAMLALGYSIAYLVIPAVRYVWLRWRNQKIAARNQQRRDQAEQLNQANQRIQHKLSFARGFAAEQIIQQQDLVYTTEEELLPQELKQAGIDWEQQLEERHPGSRTLGNK